MALVKPIIFQVVGYQNSGKTKVISELINRLKSEDLQVVSIKHHGHGGKPEIVPNKDSSQHIDSGALATIVEGDGRLLLQAEMSEWSLEQKIKLINVFDPDIILIEGYKKEQYPKLLLLRDKEDIHLCNQLSNIQAIFVRDEAENFRGNVINDLPWFQLNDQSGINWVIHYLKSQL